MYTDTTVSKFTSDSEVQCMLILKKKFTFVSRLEHYDRNLNFGMEAQEDENPYTIVTPPRADYKDMNADTEVCICHTFPAIH
jgi:hypothetical protein